MIDILPTLALCSRHPNPDAQRARLWSLVLASRHFLYKLEKGPRLLVAPKVAHLAVAEILAYESENRPRFFLPPLPDNSLASYLVLSGFIVVLTLLDEFLPGGLVAWADLARIDSGRVLGGEWYRSLTALFVHADGAHLLANGVALGVLMPILARQCGSGPAWWMFLASGALGNLLNVWLHGPGHYSVGASTGVFGIVAVLSASAGFSAPGSRMARVLIALGVGLSLLALMGSEGENTDLGAHMFGFVCGAVLGGMSGLLPRIWTRKQPMNAIWGGLAIVIALIACVMALR